MSELFDCSSRIIEIIQNSGGLDHVLTGEEVEELRRLASIDSQKLLYSAALSIGDAVYGIQKRRFSWSIVQLYYSAFYSVRALLCDNDVIFLHIDGKPYELHIQPGSSLAHPPNPTRGSTHKWSFYKLSKHFSASPLISQTIDGLDPFKWLMERRESVNYRRARFVEPNCPPELERIASGSIRNFLETYENDDTYSFDRDHAMVAFPIYCLRYVVTNLRGVDKYLISDQEFRKMDSYFVDKDGKLPSLIRLKAKIRNQDS